MAELEQRLHQGLDALEAAGRRRRLAPLDANLIDVSSNDYLGLSRHPLLIERACQWARDQGAGARASRLVAGTPAAYLELEEKLATFKGTEAALIFATGWQANASVLPALFELSDGEALVFTDRLNHASLHAGCALAGVRQIRYRHNDLAHLEELLHKHPGKLRFIVTESVFSMDGDRADVPALAALAERHGAVFYLDEAHATGVLGPDGRGLAVAAHGLIDKGSLVVMGTLGKALGSAGAYVAGSRPLIDWLINRAGGFIYSTAPAPAALGAVDAALQLMPAQEAQRMRLADMACRLRTVCAASSLDTLASSTQIVPAVIGGETDALAAAEALRQAGILAVAIRPPTVPAGSSRLRFALNAGLTEAQFERVLTAVAALKQP